MILPFPPYIFRIYIRGAILAGMYGYIMDIKKKEF